MNHPGQNLTKGKTMNAKRIVKAFRAAYRHDNPRVVSEHGQLWVTCSACGAQYSVANTSSGIDFEEVSYGDESCERREE